MAVRNLSGHLFDISDSVQTSLEGRVEKIITEVRPIQEGTIEEKSGEGESTHSDEAAKKVIFETAPPNRYVWTEEGNRPGDTKVIEVWDPIDGSSERNRMGDYRSPLTTAGMIIKGNTIIAASVGDVWSNLVFGLDQTGLYSRRSGQEEKHYLRISEEKRNLSLDGALVAVYAPDDMRHELVLPLWKVFSYVHNNGGQPFALRVVECPDKKSYSVAIEAYPTKLCEQIGPLMALYGGAAVSRMDGKPILLDTGIWQTSVTAANEPLRLNTIKTLTQNYDKLNIPHEKPV